MHPEGKVGSYSSEQQLINGVDNPDFGVFYIYEGKGLKVSLSSTFLVVISR